MPAANSAGGQELPSGWHASVDEHGSTFYHNQFTGEWSGDFPQYGSAASGGDSRMAAAGTAAISSSSFPSHKSQTISTPYSEDERSTSSSSGDDRSSSEFSDRSTGGDTSSDDDSDFSDAEGGRGGSRRRRKRGRRSGGSSSDGHPIEDILKTVDKMTETIKDSLWVAQRRASKVVQDTLPRVVELGQSVGSLSMGTAAAAYAGGSELVARAYEAAQQYLLSGGVHTEDSAQRVFQGNRTHFTPPPGTPTGVGRARLHRKSRPSPLRVLGTGTGDGIMVEVPLGSPTSAGDQREHANRALSEIGRNLAGVAMSPTSGSAV